MALDLPAIVQKIVVETDADRKIAALQTRLAALEKDLKTTTKASDDTSASVDDLGKSSDTAAPKVAKVGKAAKEAGDGVDHFGKQQDKADPKKKGFIKSLDRMIDRLQVTAGAGRAAGAVLGLIKWPAMVAAIGPAIQAVTALGGALYALTSAIAPVSGLIVAIPAAYLALGTGAVSVMVALKGVKEAIAAAAVGTKEFKEAAKGLAPEAVTFALAAHSLRDGFKGIRQAMQGQFFAGVNREFGASTRILYTLGVVGQGTSKTMGDLAGSFLRFFGRTSVLRDIGTIGETNNVVLKNLGGAALALVDAFRHVMVAAGPMLRELSALAKTGAEYAAKAAEAGRSTGRMREFFERALDTGRQLGRILGDIVGGLINIGKGAQPLGQSFLDTIEAVTTRFRDFTESVKGQESVGRFFENLRPVLSEIGGLLTDIGALVGRAFFGEGRGEQESSLVRIIQTLRAEVLPVIEQVLGSVGGNFLDNLLSVFVSLASVMGSLFGESGPLNTFLTVLAGILEVVQLLVNEVPGFKEFVVLMATLGAASKAFNVVGWATGLSSLTRTLESNTGLIGKLKSEMAKYGATAGAAATATGGTSGTGGLVGALAGLGPVGLAIGGALVVAGGALAVWTAENVAAARRVRELAAAIREAEGDIAKGTEAFLNSNLDGKNVVETLAKVESSTSSAARLARGSAKDFDAFKASLTQLARERGPEEAQAALGREMTATMKAAGASIQEIENLRRALSEYAKEQINSTLALTEDAQARVQSALLIQGNTEALAEWARITRDGTVGAEELRRSNLDMVTTLELVNDVSRQATQETAALTTEQASLAMNVAELTGANIDSSRSLKEVFEQLLRGAEGTGQLTEKQVAAIDAAGRLKNGTRDYEAALRALNGELATAAAAEEARLAAIEKRTDAVLNADRADSDLADARKRSDDQLATTYATLTDSTKSVKEHEQALDDLYEAKLAEAQASVRQAEAQAEANGQTLDAEQKSAALALELSRMADKIGGPVGASLKELANKIMGIPPSKTININADTRAAEAAMAALLRKQLFTTLEIRTKLVGNVPLEAGGVMGYESGGVIAAAAGTVTRPSRGFVTTGPTYLVGEGKPGYPEWVVPSDPAYRDRALALYEQLGRAIGVTAASQEALGAAAASLGTRAPSAGSQAATGATAAGMRDLLHVETMLVQSPTDADLVAQRISAAQRAMAYTPTGGMG
jgi:hypothetical protein